MNTLDYSLLVKDYETHKKIEKRQRIKTWLFWFTIPICFLSFFNMFDADNLIVSLIVSMLILGVLGFEAGFMIYFHSFVENARLVQIFSGEDEIDEVFIALNEKYNSHYRRARKWTYIIILFAVLGLGGGLGLIIAGAATELQGLLFGGIFCFLGFFIAIIAGTVASTLRQMRFASKTTDEVEKIKRYFYRIEGLTEAQISSKKRNIFTNVYENQKVLKYLYPDDTIRAKVQRAALAIVLPAGLAGGLLGGVGTAMLDNNNTTGFFIILGIFIAVFFGGIALYYVRFSRLVKSQREIFEADAERYKHHIELADLTKRNQKKSNIATLIILFITLVFGVIIFQFIPIEGYLFAFFGCLMLFLFLMITYLIIYYRGYRKKAKPIELKIDEHLAKLNDVFELDSDFKEM